MIELIEIVRYASMSDNFIHTPFASVICINDILDWNVYAIFGGQWGDEGKGKWLHTIMEAIYGKHITMDIIHESYKWPKMTISEIVKMTKYICMRFSGGHNAGHTLMIGDLKIATHMLPSGAIIPGCLIVIGPMCVVHLASLEKEIVMLEKLGFTDIRNRLIIDPRCVVVTDEDIQLDKDREAALGKKKIGTTLCGIGPAYERMMRRCGPFVGDREYVDLSETMATLMTTDDLFQQLIDNDGSPGLNICMEGAQSINLDKILALNLENKTQYVTSGPCTPETIWTTGLPRNVKNMIWAVIMKAYGTYVGGDIKETTDIVNEPIRINGREVGVTSGRPRQVVAFKCSQLKTIAQRFRGRGEKVVLIINKADILVNVSEMINPETGEVFGEQAFRMETTDGIVHCYKDLTALQSAITEECVNVGIPAQNIRWSMTPQADNAALY